MPLLQLAYVEHGKCNHLQPFRCHRGQTRTSAGWAEPMENSRTSLLDFSQESLWDNAFRTPSMIQSSITGSKGLSCITFPATSRR